MLSVDFRKTLPRGRNLWRRSQDEDFWELRAHSLWPLAQTRWMPAALPPTPGVRSGDTGRPLSSRAGPRAQPPQAWLWEEAGLEPVSVSASSAPKRAAHPIAPRPLDGGLPAGKAPGPAAPSRLLAAAPRHCPLPSPGGHGRAGPT